MGESTTDVLDEAYPLKVRLKERAPGTEKHAQNVANLLVAVGSELGLEVKPLRIAGIYHDIGKTDEPRYFSENQGDGEENPHDKMEPWVSLRFITAHVGATAAILVNDPNIPREVVEWCSQHHGTTVVKYFCEKSKNKREDDYRYKGVKPQSIQAALLMICDVAEATAKSLSQAGKLGNPIELVEKIFSELEQDGQLDDVPCTLGQFRRARAVIARELSATHHKRVDYEEAKDERTKKR